jgi:SAM-dependent methyltransferase
MIEETNRLTRDVTDQDALRIRELHGILEATQHLRLVDKGRKFAELGFRVPKLLKYYKDTYKMQVRGFDVLDINIFTGKELGYDVFKYDFNDCSKHLDLESEDIVVSYHMIEHLSDPLKALEKIFYSMKDLGVLHIEVPLEPGVPNIRFGHLFPFEMGDLKWMLEKVGFSIIGTSYDAHNPNFHIERHFAQKVLRPKTNDVSQPLSISHRPEEELPKNNKKD